MKGGGAENRLFPLRWGVGRGVSECMAEEGVWDVHLHPPLQTGGKQTVNSTWYHVLLPQPAAGGGEEGEGREVWWGRGGREEWKRNRERAGEGRLLTSSSGTGTTTTTTATVVSFGLIY